MAQRRGGQVGRGGYGRDLGGERTVRGGVIGARIARHLGQAADDENGEERRCPEDHQPPVGGSPTRTSGGGQGQHRRVTLLPGIRPVPASPPGSGGRSRSLRPHGRASGLAVASRLAAPVATLLGRGFALVTAVYSRSRKERERAQRCRAPDSMIGFQRSDADSQRLPSGSGGREHQVGALRAAGGRGVARHHQPGQRRRAADPGECRRSLQLCRGGHPPPPGVGDARTGLWPRLRPGRRLFRHGVPHGGASRVGSAGGERAPAGLDAGHRRRVANGPGPRAGDLRPRGPSRRHRNGPRVGLPGAPRSLRRGPRRPGHDERTCARCRASPSSGPSRPGAGVLRRGRSAHVGGGVPED